MHFFFRMFSTAKNYIGDVTASVFFETFMLIIEIYWYLCESTNNIGHDFCLIYLRGPKEFELSSPKFDDDFSTQ